MSKPKLTTPRSGWGGRGYRIPCRKEVYPGVTTILKSVNKGDGLMQWVADQTAAKAVVSIPYLMSVSEDVAWGSLRFFWSKEAELVGSEVRRYWEGVRDDAADLGTNIHEWVEADIDGLAPYPEPSSIEADEMIEAWQEWFDAHEVVSHRQEFTCVNDAMGFAGTADADWSITCRHASDEKTGLYCLGAEAGPHRTLVDVKTSRHTWPEHAYQIAALASCPVLMREVVAGHEGAAKAEKTENGKKVISWWVEDARPAWTRYALLHIRPDDLDTKGNPIPRFARLIDKTEDMDIAIDGFTGAMMIARTQKNQKARDKARGITEETEIQHG